MRSRGRISLGIVGLVAMAAGVGLTRSSVQDRAVAEVAPTAGSDFDAKVRPMLARYCLECHGETKPKAGVNLAKFTDLKSVAADRKLWERVLDNVESGLMPPSDKPQLEEPELEFLAGWIQGAVKAAACDGTPRPGRVTIRRLNRNEYDNTIRDLVGVDFHPAADFPTDDVGYGFDNIGDVLSMSPILLEKYLSAAEQVASRAILTDRTDYGANRTWKGADLRRAGGERFGDEGRILASTGVIKVTHTLEKDGEYELRVRAFGQQAGKEPVRIAFVIDGKDSKLIDVPATEGDPGKYTVRTRIPAGEHQFGIAFRNDFYDPKEPNPDRRDRNLVVLSLEVQGPIRAGAAEVPESHKRIVFVRPKTQTAAEWTAAARAILERFANRAFRRPVRPDELQKLLALVERSRQAGDSFEQAIQVAVTAVLVSPHFLFRVELDSPGRGGAVTPLDDYALASRLSYFLWSSMPDLELFQQAVAGKLRDPNVLAAQARRMLKDPKAAALVENFGMQWLQLRGLDAVIADNRLFPQFDDRLKADMLEETRQFFAHVMREDRSVLEFLSADYTFANERLARHYGLEGVTGEEFRRVELKDDRRGGVLTQASVLTVTSNPTRTSPVKRGKWVLEQILGAPPPPPPPNVPPLGESREAVLSGSLRERFEQHRADPGCASCHNRLDPLGFVFENYDAIGAWREKDGKFAIDPSGTLPSGESFQGPEEFKTYMLGRRAEFTRCLTEKMLTYALGRGLESDDACEVDRIAEAMARNEYRFGQLVVEIVTSIPFRMREGGGSQP